MLVKLKNLTRKPERGLYQADSQSDLISFIINLLCWSAITVSFILVILQYITSRSLWADEVTLAYSLVTRDLSNLVTEALKHRQSAPVIYVYIVKILTLVGENNAFFLRIYSFVAYIGTLILTHYLLKSFAKVRFPIIGTAFVSSMSVMLYFANEFKQYMSDAFTVLLVIYLYERYLAKRLSLTGLFLLYAVILWLSFPAIFYIGGIAFLIFIDSLRKRRWQQLLKTAIYSLLVIASFITQYFFWLKKASADPDLIEHWETYKFPIIPTSLDDLIRGARLIYGVAISAYDYPYVQNKISPFPILLIVLSGIGLIAVFKRNRLVISILTGTGFLMIASFIGKYPFFPRLNLFFYPFIAMLITISFDLIYDKTKNQFKESTARIAIVVLTLILIGSNQGVLSLFNAENRLRENEETEPLVKYVQENIKNDEYLYMSGADMAVKYLNGYKTLHIGINNEASFENIRYGSIKFDDESELSLDEYQQSNAYIIVSHANFEKINSLIQPLAQYNFLEKVLDVAETPLYYHTPGPDRVLTSVSYSITNLIINNLTVTGTMTVTNTGRSILNAPELPQLVLASRSNGYLKNIESTNISPGENATVEFKIPVQEAEKTLDLQIRVEDSYWFDEIGINPILIELKR